MRPIEFPGKAQASMTGSSPSVSSQSQGSSSGAGLSATSPTLLARVARREPAAWRRLTELYGPLVFHWCRRQGLSEHDAADVMQDVFASVSRAVAGFEQRAGGTFRGWLWMIARNRLRDVFRKRAGEAQAVGGTEAWQRLADVAESLSDDPDQHTGPVEMNALFQRGMDLVRGEFEDRTWQIFWRTVVEEQPTADVAVEFGITSNAVRQARSRVLRRLREELGE